VNDCLPSGCPPILLFRDAREFCAIDRVEILGRMARQNSFDLTLPQRDAWLEQIEILQRVLAHRTGRLYLGVQHSTHGSTN